MNESRRWWMLTAIGIALLSSSETYTQTASWAWKPPVRTTATGQIDILPIRGNLSMLVGAGGNITVSAGADGILMVDDGRADMAEKVWTAVQSISRGPLRYIVNTSEDVEHSGGNDFIAPKGSTIPFRPPEDNRVSDGMRGVERANIIAYLSVFDRMSAPTGAVAPRAESAWPDNTYSSPQKKLFFNNEPVVIMHVPSNTDGNSIVHFRGADVISVGDLVDLRTYPVIDLAAGGSIQAVVQALNRVIEITVPGRKSEEGTLVVPGHGRLADQPDIVYYQQMTAIVRDRIKNMIGKGMTLDQVKAARPTRDYDPRFGATTGAWTTDMFVEAAYASLKN